MEITLPTKPQPIAIKTEKTGMIVVDMQNAFCRKGGLFDAAGRLDEERIRPVIENNRQLIAGVRKHGMKVIYLTMGYRPDLADAWGPDSPNYWKEGSLAALRLYPELKGKCLTVDSWDAKIIDELAPQPQDIVVNKNRFSGFANTGLDGILKNNTLQYLIFSGVFTNICVESTLRDAFFQEYFPILVSDGCANSGPAFTQEATIWAVTSVFGWVLDTASLLKSLSSHL
jgi:ureidoacrylate peracid hydrolase